MKKLISFCIIICTLTFCGIACKSEKTEPSKNETVIENVEVKSEANSTDLVIVDENSTKE